MFDNLKAKVKGAVKNETIDGVKVFIKKHETTIAAVAAGLVLVIIGFTKPSAAFGHSNITINNNYYIKGDFYNG